MQRPEVRVVQGQQVEQVRDVTGYEAEQLLRKYGYQDQHFSTIPAENTTEATNDLTFEEMVAQEEMKKKEIERKKDMMHKGPKPSTFDGRKGYDSEIKYGSDEETGFGFKIQIVSDMPIPKY